MTMPDVWAGLSWQTAAIVLAAFGAFGALFCRVRQLTLAHHRPQAWILYVAFALTAGLIGMRALFFAVAYASDVCALLGIWALLLHTYASWDDGPPLAVVK